MCDVLAAAIKHFLYDPLTMDNITLSASYFDTCSSLDPFSIRNYSMEKHLFLYDFFCNYVLAPDFPFIRVQNIQKVESYLRELADGDIPTTGQEHLDAIKAYMNNPTSTEFLVRVRILKSYK